MREVDTGEGVGTEVVVANGLRVLRLVKRGVAGVVSLLMLLVLVTSVVAAEHVLEEAELGGCRGEKREEHKQQLHIARTNDGRAFCDSRDFASNWWERSW